MKVIKSDKGPYQTKTNHCYGNLKKNWLEKSDFFYLKIYAIIYLFIFFYKKILL